MVPNSSSLSFQLRGSVRLVSTVKGKRENVQEPASNRPYPHVCSTWDGRSMGNLIRGMLMLAIFCLPLLR